MWRVEKAGDGTYLPWPTICRRLARAQWPSMAIPSRPSRLSVVLGSSPRALRPSYAPPRGHRVRPSSWARIAVVASVLVSSARPSCAAILLGSRRSRRVRPGVLVTSVVFGRPPGVWSRSSCPNSRSVVLLGSRRSRRVRPGVLVTPVVFGRPPGVWSQSSRPSWGPHRVRRPRGRLRRRAWRCSSRSSPYTTPWTCQGCQNPRGRGPGLPSHGTRR
jgi:hypothetical protein